MSDIFREVDEEVRADRIKEFWQRWGSLIIGGAVAIVLGVAIRVYWIDYQDGVQQAESVRLDEAKALLDDGSTSEALPLLEALVADTDSGYKIIAEFRVAASLVEMGDTEGALNVYESLSSNSSLEDRYRELASLLSAALLMDTASSEDLIARLDPLAVQGGDWFFSATELLGIISLREGDVEGAESRFSAITLDPLAPPSLKQRAQEVLDVIDSQKPDEILFEEETPAEETPSEEGDPQ